jgi:hypothetical protein
MLPLQVFLSASASIGPPHARLTNPVHTLCSAVQTVRVRVAGIQSFNPYDKVQSNLHMSMNNYAVETAAGLQEAWRSCALIPPGQPLQTLSLTELS